MPYYPAKVIIPGTQSSNGQANGRRHDYARVFKDLGVVLTMNGSAEAQAEECPFCGRGRFYLNTNTGLYDCKQCQTSGNLTTFLTWLHGQYLEATKPEHYSRLARQRGVAAPQTLRRHQLAYASNLGGSWLVPFMSAQGNIANLMRYYPEKKTKPNKYMLPELPTAIYGFDRLMAADDSKPVLLCEGPFDAIALDYSIGAENRGKYVIVATPGAFKDEWAEHFRGRKVRALYDNDEAGRKHTARVHKLLGESGVAAELLALKWPDGLPEGYDVHDLVKERRGKKVLGWLVENCYEVVHNPKLAWVNGRDLEAQGPEFIEWVWPDRMRCGSYVSYSGKGGTLKSTLMREIVARYTVGKPLPGCDKVGLPAGHVIYVTAEDSPATVGSSLKRAGADLGRVQVLPATLVDGHKMNILEHLDELRQKVRQLGVRLVVIDGQNSTVGAPCIATDMLARNNVTDKLHQFAQRENVCLVGIRNEDQEGRAYGPASMGDVARCILRSVELPPHDGERYFELRFEKVSDAAPSTHPPMPYSVEDLGGSARRILWEKARPKEVQPPPIEIPEDGEAIEDPLMAELLKPSGAES